MICRGLGRVSNCKFMLKFTVADPSCSRDCLCIYENQLVVTLPRSASFLMQAAFLEWS